MSDSQPHSSSPAPADVSSQIASYKRRIDEMQRLLDEKNAPAQKDITWRTLGRVIKRVIALDTPVHDMLVEYDRQDTQDTDTDDDNDEYNEGDLTNEQKAEKQAAKELKRDRQRVLTGFKILCKVIPKLQKALDTLDSAELRSICSKLDTGAGQGRNDDVSTAKEYIVECLNARTGDRVPNPPLQVTCKLGRGFVNNATGRLLCPSIELDWEDEPTRSRIRNDEIEELCDSYFIRFLYDDEKGARGSEQGLLMGPLLVQMYKKLFLSKKDASGDVYSDETKRPRKRIKISTRKSTRKNVAQMIGMTEVSPRAIAYCAVMVRFALSDAGSWGTDEGFNYNGFYHCVVDYFEDNAPGSAGEKNARKLLKWWNKQIYPKEDRATSRKPFRNFKNTLEAERARII